jgi:hypothetical protein
MEKWNGRDTNEFSNEFQQKDVAVQDESLGQRLKIATKSRRHKGSQSNLRLPLSLCGRKDVDTLFLRISIISVSDIRQTEVYRTSITCFVSE